METKQVLSGYAIVVVDRGFVYVGHASVIDDWCVIDRARNIRIWGTTGGLGELARTGPTDQTRLDDVGIVRVPMHALISLIDTEESLWKS